MAYDFKPTTPAANEMGAIPASSMESARAQVLNMRPTSRFLYIHHPDAWQLIESDQGFEWLPQLKSFRLTPGVNGVRQTRGKNPKADDRAARVNLADRGYTVIPYDAIEGGYCWKYLGRGGAVYLERWAVPKQVGNRTILKPDQEGLWAFSRHLIAKGFISLPDPDVLQIIEDTHRQSLERDAQNCHHPAVAARHAVNLRRLEGMEAATKVLFPPPPKKVAPRKAAKAKAKARAE